MPGERLRRGLAALERDGVREVGGVPRHELVEPPERDDALLERRRRPGGKRARSAAATAAATSLASERPTVPMTRPV